MADVYDLFLHNWQTTVGMDTAWQTDVVASAENLVEARTGLTTKPRRTITVRWEAIDQGEAHRLFFLLARMGHQRLRVPLYQDVVRTTAASSGVTINCVPTNRRFHVGQRIVIHERTDGRPTNVQHRVIGAVGATTITVTVALTGTVAADALVYPVLDVEILLEAQGEGLTDHVATVQATFDEQAVGALPASEDYAGIAGDYETGTSAAGGTYYIFDFGPNWAKNVQIAMSRSGNQVTLNRGNVVTTRGPRPAYSFGFACEESTKDEAARLIQFFDAHQGRLIPFFIANPLTLFNVENMGTTFVDVTRYGDIDDPTLFADYLFLEMDNGDVYVREITAVANNAGLNRLSVTLPALVPADVKRATTAHLVRFASDALREEWYTDTVALFNLELVEVLNEEVEVALP